MIVRIIIAIGVWAAAQGALAAAAQDGPPSVEGLTMQLAYLGGRCDRSVQPKLANKILEIIARKDLDRLSELEVRTMAYQYDYFVKGRLKAATEGAPTEALCVELLTEKFQELQRAASK